MALNSNAICLLTEAKTFLGISGATEDARIELLINMASESIERFCKRKLSTQTHTEYQDGRAMNKLLLREWPITGGPADGNTKPEIFEDADWGFGTETAIDVSEYEVVKGIEIVRKDGTFQKGYRNLKIVYQAGEGLVTTGSSTNTFPSDLVLACLKYVEWLDLHTGDRRIGLKNKGKMGETTTYETDVPMFIQKLLEPHVREEFPSANVGIRNA